jgi:hypothetical protein
VLLFARQMVQYPGYPFMQVVQYSVPACTWPDPHRPYPPPGANIFFLDDHLENRLLMTFLFLATVIQPTSGIRKYVIWCLICGGTSTLLGILFLGVYFLIRSYTSTVGYFETVPNFVPSTLVSLFWPFRDPRK